MSNWNFKSWPKKLWNTSESARIPKTNPNEKKDRFQLNFSFPVKMDEIVLPWTLLMWKINPKKTKAKGRVNQKSNSVLPNDSEIFDWVQASIGSFGNWKFK